MRHLRALALLLVVLAAASAQTAKYAGPGGKVSIKYGAPRYRAELMLQARPGLVWRLGADTSTTIETTGALVWREGVVFPGTYNLGAVKISDTRWNLIFHRDGNLFRSGKDWGQPSVTQGLSDSPKERSDRLLIELKPAADRALRKAGGAHFRVRFGPHFLEAPLSVLKVTKRRHRLGKLAFQLETVKLPATPEWEKVISGEHERAFTFARLTLRKDTQETLLALEPGSPPLLKLLAFNREVPGQRQAANSAAKDLQLTLAEDTLTLHLAETELIFPFEPGLLSKAETGGTTGR